MVKQICCLYQPCANTLYRSVTSYKLALYKTTPAYCVIFLLTWSQSFPSVSRSFCSLLSMVTYTIHVQTAIMSRSQAMLNPASFAANWLHGNC